MNFEDHMTQPLGNEQTRFVAKMNQAIEFANGGQVSRAVQLLTDLLAEFGNAAGVHGYLAWYLLEMGRQEEAIEHSRQATKLAPNSEKASLIHFHVLWKAAKQ